MKNSVRAPFPSHPEVLLRVLWRGVKSGAYVICCMLMLAGALWLMWKGGHFWQLLGWFVAGLLVWIFEVLVKSKTSAMGRLMVFVGGMGLIGGLVADRYSSGDLPFFFVVTSTALIAYGLTISIEAYRP